MYFNPYLSVFLLNHYIIFGFGLFQSTNVFRQLNKKIDDIVQASGISDFGVETRWIEQNFDHFNSNDERKWKMRYLEYTIFFKSNGPVYLYLGGESLITSSWAVSGIASDLAKETNGAVYVSEHRYYGESKPFDKYTAENLKFLNERQALADIAHLLKYLKQKSIYKNSKIVVIGGSYPGNLAAWMRLLYPELVDAALSSSAPVLAKKDFYEYLEKVNDNYVLYGTQGCIDRIKQKFIRYEKLLQSAEGIRQLKKEESICDSCDLTIKETQQVFLFVKFVPFMVNSQSGSLSMIKDHCNHLDDNSYNNSTDDELSFYTEDEKCFNYDFKFYIHQLRQDESYLCWVYQTCTAFGYFQTANSMKQPFTNNVPLTFFTKTCEALFGPDFNEKRVDEGVNRVNSMYGGLRPKVTKVVFTNGELDPWSNLGVLKNISNEVPAVYIPHASHCKDLISVTDNHEEHVKEAVRRIKDVIKYWIGIK